MPISINGVAVEWVNSIRFFRVHISEDLKRSLHVDTLVKKFQQCLSYLRRLRKFALPLPILRNFYRFTTDSVLTGCITAW